jgi:hypothetical protein
MFRSRTAERRIGRLAWVTAWVGLVAGQLHALARHQTADGQADLATWSTRVWSDPGRRLLRPLLDWADPDVVYVTWGKIWLPVFVAFTLCAFVVRRRRQPHGFERWAWRVALTGYVAACISAAGEYWTSWATYHAGVVDAFFPLTLLSLLLTVAGSTMLGISWLRQGLAPRVPGWLLALVLPEVLVIVQVTSQGNAALPVLFAFGLLGRRLAAEPTQAAPLTVPAPLSAG